jgi:agmatine deiminase
MKSKILLFLLFCSSVLLAQRDILPVGPSEEERAMQLWNQFVTPAKTRGIGEPPPHPVRHMAEWEELQALCITWRTSPVYLPLLTQIADYASKEVPVVIFCNTQSVKTQAEATLQSAGVNLGNIQFSIVPNNSVWIRDYGPNCVYANEVDSLYFIDWIYNRLSRPLDDALPDGAGDHFNIPVYATTEDPTDLVHTGGNFMSDGLGTAFASKLTLLENGTGPQNIYNAGPHTPEDIDAILNSFMGIDRFIKMDVLPYDGIHHIDMHMKLLDEETLLVGQYPDGVADGPQIEANLQYVLDNFTTSFGTPYKVVRVVQPPDFSNQFPNQDGDYRTYTNSVLVNKTILVPTYEEQYDTTALRIYRENFPGYKVYGIDCNNIIQQSGALHCITKEIGVNDPLWMVHQRLNDIEDNELHGNYEVTARIKHRSGIANAQVYFTTDTLAGYSSASLTLTDPETGTWSGFIPHQPDGSVIYYYIRGQANTAKTQVRPLAAPAGYYRFKVEGSPVATSEPMAAAMSQIYPNPASAITVIPVSTNRSTLATIEIFDVLGKQVETIFNGNMSSGASNHFLDAARLAPGTYFIVLKTNNGVQTQKLVVK